METEKKKKFMKVTEKPISDKAEKPGLHEVLSNVAHDRAKKVHKASASHKTIRQALYGHKE